MAKTTTITVVFVVGYITILNSKISSHKDIATLTQSLTKSSVLTIVAQLVFGIEGLKQSCIDVVQRTHRAEASDLPCTFEPCTLNFDAYIKKKKKWPESSS